MGAYSDKILATSGLQSYWKLDEASGSPADSKGSLTGTVSGTLSYAQSGATKISGLSTAIKGNGSTGRVEFGDNLRFSGTSNYTVECWAKLPSTGNRIICKYDESTGNGWLFAFDSSSGKVYAARHNGTTLTDILGSTALTSGVWYHIACTYDGSNLKVFVNGVQDGSVASSISIGSPTTKVLTFFSSSGGGNYCDVTMQHVAIYNTALSAATLLDHFQGVAASDTWAWQDSASYTKFDYILGGHNYRGRTTSDAWAWSDAAALRGAPAARTAIGSRVAIFTSNGSAGTFGAHYAFGMTVALPDGKSLLSIARKASTHASYDGIIVGKLSTDDGNTWGSEFTIVDETSGSWDWRDPYLTVLASGRLVLTGGRRKTSGGFDYSQAPFLYTDDRTGQTGWTSTVVLSDAETGCFAGTLGSAAGGCYGSDIVEKANGDLLLFGYGFHSSGSSVLDLFCSKSTDGGATWSALSKPALGSTYGFNVVEPQADIMSTGDIYLTFHTEDGVPTDWYRTRSQNSGTSWTTPLKVGSSDTFNRQGMSVFQDDRVIVSVNYYSGFLFAYYESYNGNLFGSLVTVDTNAPVVGYSYNLWIMVTPLGGTGDSQNVGFTYGAEVGTQDKASIWYRQFTGTNGAKVYRRGTADSWAWTDSAARGAVTRPRTTSDAWAWSDTAPRTIAVAKTTGDSWAWRDAASAVLNAAPVAYSRTTSDTWLWVDAATAVLNAAPVAYSRTTSDTWLWVDAATETHGATPLPARVFIEHYAYPLVKGAHYPHPKVYAKHGPTEGA